MNKNWYILILMACLAIACKHEETSIKPGQVWNDTDGNPINAHSAGILYDSGKYYWFGEIKIGKTWLVERTGWDPNPAAYGVSDSIMGNYRIIENPCRGKDADKTFYAQSTFILPVQGRNNVYIALFDRWNKLNLEDSRYVWLPMHFENDKMIIEWKDDWKLE